MHLTFHLQKQAFLFSIALTLKLRMNSKQLVQKQALNIYQHSARDAFIETCHKHNLLSQNVKTVNQRVTSGELILSINITVCPQTNLLGEEVSLMADVLSHFL